MRLPLLFPILGLSIAHSPPPINATINANHIFNTIQDSLRQWGSSLHHNGVSFFLARVPAGTQFYHGTSKDSPVTGTEWLAFEPEHAMVFARLRSPPLPPPNDREQDGHGELRKRHEFERSGLPHSPPPGTSESEAGYLHTYTTSKDLRLLYVDGMSAAKCDKGTLDSQDLVLFNGSLDQSPDGGWKETERARRACELADNGWEGRIDGILRMEAGFEIILCHFERDLTPVRITRVKKESMRGSPGKPGPMNKHPRSDSRIQDDLPDPVGQGSALHEAETHDTPHKKDNDRRHGPRSPAGPGGPGGPNHGTEGLGWMRAVTSRYNGIGGNRVSLNLDHFVTAFSHDVDLFQGARLPRLSNLPQSQLSALRDEVTQMIKTYHPAEVCEDWQAIADLIVTRYSDNLLYFASGKIRSLSQLQEEIEGAMSPFIDFDNRDPEAEIGRCAMQFVPPRTLEGGSLAGKAVYGVAKKICSSLVEAQGQESLQSAVHVIQELIEHLDWVTWKECRGCKVHEICVVPIWPMGGTLDDYEHPKCKDASNPYEQGRENYWSQSRLEAI